MCTELAFSLFVAIGGIASRSKDERGIVKKWGVHWLLNLGPRFRRRAS